MKISDFSELGRVIVVAEIGVNHEGDFTVAKELIKQAKAAGADAVKFQTFTRTGYVARNQKERFERAQRFCLSFAQFKRLASFANENGLLFFSTPLDFDSVDFLDQICPIFKISSGDLTNRFLVRKIASKRKPIILSTGLSTVMQIKACLSVIRKECPGLLRKKQVMLMHCVSFYPVAPEDANLLSIPFLREVFRLPVGYSDHTMGTLACEAAVVLGARAIEKHFTYKKENQAFHDHCLSADPQDLRSLVQNIRKIELLLGKKGKQITKGERSIAANMQRSLGARRRLKKGQVISRGDITFLRPATGILLDDFEKIIGMKVSRDIREGELLGYSDIA